MKTEFAVREDHSDRAFPTLEAALRAATELFGRQATPDEIACRLVGPWCHSLTHAACHASTAPKGS